MQEAVEPRVSTVVNFPRLEGRQAGGRLADEPDGFVRLAFDPRSDVLN